jgi:hypothetical protein
MLLVRAPAGDRWMQFRDVFEVDGKPVRDRAERLAKLFLQPSASTQQQVDDISAASARYNIGGVNRNVNLPVLALTVLEPQNRAWFSFKGGKKTGNLFDLEFREERSGTLIRTAGDQSLPARGRFTIDLATGRAGERADRGKRQTAGADRGGTRWSRRWGLRASGSARATRSPTADDRGRPPTRFRRHQVVVDEKVSKRGC